MSKKRPYTDTTVSHVPAEPDVWKGRPGLLPPLGVDFETALGALLKTPPPPKGERPKRRRKSTRKKRG